MRSRDVATGRSLSPRAVRRAGGAAAAGGRPAQRPFAVHGEWSGAFSPTGDRARGTGGSTYRCGSAPDFDRTSPAGHRSLARTSGPPSARAGGAGHTAGAGAGGSSSVITARGQRRVGGGRFGGPEVGSRHQGGDGLRGERRVPGGHDARLGIVQAGEERGAVALAWPAIALSALRTGGRRRASSARSAGVVGVGRDAGDDLDAVPTGQVAEPGLRQPGVRRDGTGHLGVGVGRQGVEKGRRGGRVVAPRACVRPGRPMRREPRFRWATRSPSGAAARCRSSCRSPGG